MNLDERIDEIIGDSFRGLYMLHDDIVTPVDDKYNVLHNFLKQAIKQLIEEESLEKLIEQALPDLREIVWHSDGRVIAKTGANAKYPKKLYGNDIRSALSKIIEDKLENK